MSAVWRTTRAPAQAAIFQVLEGSVITLPKRRTTLKGALGVLQLSVQESGGQLAWQVGTANIHPFIFRHFSARKSKAVGAFFPDDLGAFNEFVPIDDKCTALARDNILGLVEAERGESALPPERLATPVSTNSLCCIFNYDEVVLRRGSQDRVHFATDTSIVDDRDSLRAGCYCLLNELFVNVQSIRSDIHKDRGGTA